jgi:hypothetical protein
MLKRILSFIRKPQQDKKTKKSKWILGEQVSRIFYNKEIYSYQARKRIVVGDETYHLKSYIKYNATDELLYTNITFGDITFHEEVGALQGYNENFIAQHYDAIIWPAENKFMKTLKGFIDSHSRTL